MAESSPKLRWFVGVGLVLITAVVAFKFVQSKKEPPFPVLRQVKSFTLTNQLGKSISLTDLKGQVWLANIIFTRCAGPCPRITRQFATIQSNLPPSSPVKLISLTADPAYDSPEVLKKYAGRFGAAPEKWYFLTGPKKEIYDLALDSLMLAVQEKAPNEQTSMDDLFIHSTIFVLVDKKGDVRAFYESDEAGTEERVLADINKLTR